MAITPAIRAPQGGALVVSRRIAASDRVTQGAGLVVYNIPAKNLASTQAGFTIALRKQAKNIAVTQAEGVAIVRGRGANPRIRAWTFTLDGHDFYVLRLGDTETLLYDLSSEQWVDWTSPTLSFWRANAGMTWTGGQALANEYGSDIVVGDDTWGLLWFLDPEQGFDEPADYTSVAQAIPFERIVTGQVLTKGRQAVPCYTIFLDGDNYGQISSDFVATVKLSTSDDQGRTFDDHDTLQSSVDTADDDYRWYSLGQITSPGRIFKITDNGVFARIDSMEMNDDGG